MKLHERIHRWRKGADLTMEALAKKCGVSSAAVAQWEDPDGTTPTSENIEKIAKAVGVSMSEFWGGAPTAVTKKSKTA